MKYTNNAKSALASSINATVTTITLATGKGALFASDLSESNYQIATLVNSLSILEAPEIIRITDRTGDVLTVVRGQEGTTAKSWPAATTELQGRVTAGMLSLFWEKDETTDEESTQLGKNSLAPGDRATAIGYGSEANGDYSSAFGIYADAKGQYSSAIGRDSATYGEKSLGFGSYAESFAERSVAIGDDSRGWVKGGLTTTAFPAVQRESFWSYNEGDGGLYKQFLAMPVVLSSPHFELGPGLTWQASTEYRDGDVVAPTTPGGFFYRLVVEATRNFDYLTNSYPLDFRLTTDATEPTWPDTVAGDEVTANSDDEGFWQAMPDYGVAWELVLPEDVTFYPDEAGFICTDYDAVTTEPVVSIGNEADPVLLVDNESLTGITSANSRQRFVGLTKGVTGKLLFTVDALASGGAGCTMQGRFYVTGIFVQNKG